jgi:NAD(P)-dependent dehydrogenase (short-subunit alcohol dehydrogenase family)
MGLAVVEDLVAKGWNITIFDFDHVSGANVAGRLGPQVLFIKGNAAKYEDLGAAFAETWKKWGSIDFGKFCIEAHAKSFQGEERQSNQRT